LPDGVTALNETGYRMVRSSIGVTEGDWFYEIECLSHSGNVRLGWSTEKGDVQAPVGYDKYSYSYRDKEGTKFHMSRGLTYGQPYGTSDVIGFFISLPKRESPPEQHDQKDNISQQSLDTQQQQQQISKKPEGDPKTHQGSKVVFFKNGQNQGVAFLDIFDGIYYPAASLYMGGTVKFNFGPHFKYPPPSTEFKFSPICDAVLPELVEPVVPALSDEVKQEITGIEPDNNSENKI